MQYNININTPMTLSAEVYIYQILHFSNYILIMRH